jgi:hypothetical protein
MSGDALIALVLAVYVSLFARWPWLFINKDNEAEGGW